MSLFPKIETFNDLIGRKSDYDGIRAWMKSWSKGIVPQANPAIIIGESGTGKTTIANLVATESKLDPITHDHERELEHTFINGRTPTFFGQDRAVILDDYSFTRTSDWKMIETEVGRQAFPIIICVEHEKNVPWPIRRGSLTLKLERPSISQIAQYLSRNYPDESQDLVQRVAESSSSWRTAILTLLSTPGEHEIIQTPRSPTRIGNAEIEAILSGKHLDYTFSNHPLAILSAAEYNHANPAHVASANLLHSRSWEADDLTHISRGYLTTLRASSSDPPPFRKRKISGSIRRV